MKLLSPEIKQLAYSGLERLGVDRFAVSLHRQDALVLVYHAILPEENVAPFRFHHPIDEFEAQLDWLGVHCTPVGLSDFIRWKRGDWNPRRPPVLITFDDGYRNNATLAASLLIRKGFPAIFFLATGYIGSRQALWPEELFARVVSWPDDALEDPSGTIRVVPAHSTARAEFALAMVEECKSCTDQRRREFLAYLASRTPSCEPLWDEAAQQMMSWDEARALRTSGFDLGSHTVSHPILSKVSPGALIDELRQSRAAIERETNAPCDTLAYPVGRSSDFADCVEKAARETGYTSAFTVSNRWCSRASDPFRLDRIAPPGHSDRSTFSFHASGLRRWFPPYT